MKSAKRIHTVHRWRGAPIHRGGGGLDVFGFSSAMRYQLSHFLTFLLLEPLAFILSPGCK